MKAHVYWACAYLEKFHEVNTEPLFTTTGAPSDDWLLGFIWAMGMAWHDLTGGPITAGGRFTRFLEYALPAKEKSERPKTIDWDARIKTAVERFHMDREREQRLRPGDDFRKTIRTG
jgi:hypothetical protein